jgi:hypothetical protein
MSERKDSVNMIIISNKVNRLKKKRTISSVYTSPNIQSVNSRVGLLAETTNASHIDVQTHMQLERKMPPLIPINRIRPISTLSSGFYVPMPVQMLTNPSPYIMNYRNPNTIYSTSKLCCAVTPTSRISAHHAEVIDKTRLCLLDTINFATVACTVYGHIPSANCFALILHYMGHSPSLRVASTFAINPIWPNHMDSEVINQIQYLPLYKTVLALVHLQIAVPGTHLQLFFHRVCHSSGHMALGLVWFQIDHRPVVVVTEILDARHESIKYRGERHGFPRYRYQSTCSLKLPRPALFQLIPSPVGRYFSFPEKIKLTTDIYFSIGARLAADFEEDNIPTGRLLSN